MRTNKLATRGSGWRWRYPGRGFNPTGRQSTRYESTIQRPPSPPLGPLLQMLSEANFLAADQAQSSRGGPAEITHCAYVASFSWLDRAPPAWTPLDEPRRLEEDKGDYFRDPNAARFPSYPLEPAVRTLLTEHEDLETQEIDLFACSSTVGSLLRFVRRVDKPFRFFVEVVGNTVFFTRHENSPTQLLVGVKGYGHTFPEAYMMWDADVKGSASHQRLLRYNFAGLDCILRFECDGYLRSKVPRGVDAPAAARGQQIGEGGNDLTSVMDRIKVSSSLAGGENHKGPLRIKKSGRKIPQEAIFDLKTRAGWKKDLNVLEDELPRYWLAQIPNFILARHDGGVFDNIEVHHIRDDVQKWQGENQKDLRRLVWLLREIIAAAKVRKDRKLEVYCKGLDALELREQDTDEHDVLPPELKLRWMEDGPSEGKQPESDNNSTGSEAFPAVESDISDDGRRFGFDSDEESEKDYTACSADSCGYCGHCSY
ncbi:MAG: hypothetical protein LQ339_007857 [Xanthoria mediterranea]|nr:MAG: hypothetical protein LQ339_007857 [Xanthoria mediterranea]